MEEDIRDKPFITHQDVIGLNFINATAPFVFRRHFRQGLRSHVMEILHPTDVELETSGTLINGIRQYPKAKPHKIFRLFRTRLNTLEQALKEIHRVMMVEAYLAPDYMARSDEFLVDYIGPKGAELMLCGFQEYIDGEILDPWSLLDGEAFRADLYERLRKMMPGQPPAKALWIEAVQHKAGIFIQKIKAMITETGHIPDLAGVGNMLMVGSGQIKLVDINNISPVSTRGTISVDDRGYPVCDKSIEALSRLEQKLLGHDIVTHDQFFGTFLNPERIAEVKLLENRFYRKLDKSI